MHIDFLAAKLRKIVDEFALLLLLAVYDSTTFVIIHNEEEFIIGYWKKMFRILYFLTLKSELIPNNLQRYERREE